MTQPKVALSEDATKPLALGKAGQSSICGHLWHIQHKSVIFGACFFLRAFLKRKLSPGNWLLLWSCSWRMGLKTDWQGVSVFPCRTDGWIYSALQQIFLCGSCLLHTLIHNELYFSIVMIYLWQGLTIAPLTYARKLWGRMTSQKSLMEWMVWKTGCQSYGKKAL